MLSPVVVVLGGLRRGRGRAKGVLEEAVLCGDSAGGNSIDVISQSPVGPRAGAVFSRGPRCPSSLSKALLFQRGCSLGCELLSCPLKMRGNLCQHEMFIARRWIEAAKQPLARI